MAENYYGLFEWGYQYSAVDQDQLELSGVKEHSGGTHQAHESQSLLWRRQLVGAQLVVVGKGAHCQQAKIAGIAGAGSGVKAQHDYLAVQVRKTPGHQVTARTVLPFPASK